MRAKVSVRADLIRGTEAEPLEVLDASLRGLLVRLRAPVPTLHLMRLRIHLPRRVINTHGVSARVDGPFADGSWQVGLRFFALNGIDQRDWETFMLAALRLLQQRAA